jgi:hypothetical protein
MKAIKPTTVLLPALFVSLFVLSQPNSILNYLPANAKMIVKINPASLREKIKWEDLIKYKMFEDMLKEFPETGKEFLENPAHTGIDLSHGFFLVIPDNKNNEKLDPVFYAIPQDTARISAMVKKIFPGKKPMKAGNARLIVDKHTALAWNKDVIILTGDDAKKDTATQNSKPGAPSEATRLKNLADRCKNLLSKHQPGSKNEHLSSFLNEQGDLLLWVNNTVQTAAQKKTKMPEALGMLNKSFMHRGDYVSGIINFENGRVVGQMKQYISTSLDSLYEKYPLRNINTGLLKKLPDGHPIILLSFSFSPEMLGDLYQKSGTDKLIDSMSKHKIKMDEILPAIKGDVMFAVMKTDEVDEGDSVTKAMNGLQLFVAGSINDKEKFKNLAALLQNKKQDTAKRGASKKNNPVILSNDSIFVVSLSPVAAQKFLGSGTNEKMQKLIDPYSAHPSAILIDLKTIFGFVMQSALKNKPEEEARQASEVLGMFDKIVGYGGRHDDHSISSTFELILVNKDENSLKQFMNLLNLFYSLKPKKSTAYK